MTIPAISARPRWQRLGPLCALVAATLTLAACSSGTSEPAPVSTAAPAPASTDADEPAAPKASIELTRWNITLPVDEAGSYMGSARTVPAPEIQSLFDSGSAFPYFYPDADGAIVFEVPSDGAVSGSSTAPRSELRETLSDGTLLNWTPADLGGTHVLEADCVVNQIGPGGGVSIGQIHAKVPNIPAVILRYVDDNGTPVIYATVKRNPDDPRSQDVLRFPGVALGAPIRYQMRMIATANSIMLTITVNDVARSVDMYANSPDWADTTFYFKAGNYYLRPVDGWHSKVTFYSLSHRHGTD